MSNDSIEARMWEVPVFALGMWLMPSVIGYVLVGVLAAIDVMRWSILLLEWIVRRR